MKASPIRGEGALGAIIGFAVWAFIIWVVVTGIGNLFNGDSRSSSGASGYSGNRYYDDSGYEEEEEYYNEPENPYSSDTGHSAGYEWAEENDVDSCGGNSNSFIEGCEEYVSQRDEYEYQEYEDDSDHYDRY